MIQFLIDNWQTIPLALVTILGGILVLLRPIAAFTSWTGDNRAVAGIEWLMHWITKLFLPTKLADGSSSGGKGKDVA